RHQREKTHKLTYSSLAEPDSVNLSQDVAARSRNSKSHSWCCGCLNRLLRLRCAFYSIGEIFREGERNCATSAGTSERARSASFNGVPPAVPRSSASTLSRRSGRGAPINRERFAGAAVHSTNGKTRGSACAESMWKESGSAVARSRYSCT